jgi:hypothetical protein
MWMADAVTHWLIGSVHSDMERTGIIIADSMTHWSIGSIHFDME